MSDSEQVYQSEIFPKLTVVIIYPESERYALLSKQFEKSGHAFLLRDHDMMVVDGDAVGQSWFTPDHLLVIQAHEAGHYMAGHAGDAHAARDEAIEREADWLGYNLLKRKGETSAADLHSQEYEARYDAPPGDHDELMAHLQKHLGESIQEKKLRGYVRELLVEEKVLALGRCFPFAYQKAEEWFEAHFTKGGPGRRPKRHPDLNDKSKFKVVHGTVTDKWKDPPKPIVHGWVEMGDLVFDDQTKYTKPDGIAREFYYDMYQPDPQNEYTAEEVLNNCAKYGGEGPWNEELHATMLKRDAWLDEGRLLREFEDISPESERHPRHLKTVGQVLDLIQRLQDETDKGGLATRIKSVGVEFAKVAMGEIPIVGGALGAADGLYAMYQAGKDDTVHSWDELEEYPILNRMDMHPTLARHLDPVTLRKIDNAYQEYLGTLSRATLVKDITDIDEFAREWILDDTTGQLDVELLKEYLQKVMREEAIAVAYKPQSPAFEAYLKEYESISQENPFDWRTRYFVMGETDDGKICVVQTSVQFFDEAIHMGSIQTTPPGECEGKGYASKVMQRLIDLADKHGVVMSLDPHPFGQKTLGVGDLKGWYKRVGFKPDRNWGGEWRRKPLAKEGQIRRLVRSMLLAEATVLPNEYFEKIDGAVKGSRFWEESNDFDDIDIHEEGGQLQTPAVASLEAALRGAFTELGLDVDIYASTFESDDPSRILSPDHPAYPNRWLIDARWYVSKQDPGRNVVDLQLMASNDEFDPSDIDPGALVRDITQTVRHELVHYQQMKKQAKNKGLDDIAAFEEMVNDPRQVPPKHSQDIRDYLDSHIEIDAHAHDGAEELLAAYGLTGALDMIRGDIDLTDPKLPNGVRHYFEQLPADSPTLKKLRSKLYTYIKLFNSRVTESVLKEGVQLGDCYEAAAKYMMDECNFGADDCDLALVHGEVSGQGPLEGVRYGHAWVEDGDTVIDKSNGKDLRMPKAIYYALGQINRETFGADGYDPVGGQNVHRYTWPEMRKKLLDYEHWGPWDLETSSGL